MKLHYKLVVCCLLILLFVTEGYSQSREYMLKAGFLEKFARLSEWPPNTKIDTFKIKVIGRSPFQGALEEMYNTNPILKKPVLIEYISSIDDINDCHILFISSSETRRIGSIIQQVGSKPIITVGETKGYISQGVIINFFETKNGTVHFEISKRNVAKSKIKLDIMLLNFAKLVE